MTVELSEPVGWVTLQLNDPTDRDKLLRTHLLQLKVLSMHQNGRDTHIRQLKVLGHEQYHFSWLVYRYVHLKLSV